MSNNYAEILSQEGLKGLRKRRSMYLGSTGILSEHHAPGALTQTVQEVVSNSIDEFVEGYGHEINVTVHENNAVTVKDFARGMPKGPGNSFDHVIRALTVPHSSGKFDEAGYSGTGIAGMNGIGLKATSATSKWMELEAIAHASTTKNGETVLTGGYEHYRIKTEQETVLETELLQIWDAKDVEKIDGTSFKDLQTGNVYHTGTSITYLPDDGPVSETRPIDLNPVFESIKFVNADLLPRFKSSAFLNAGLVIHYTDERELVENPETKEQHFLQYSWYYKDGVAEYAKETVEGRTTVKGMDKPITFTTALEYKGLQYKMQAAFYFTNDLTPELYTYANGVPTKAGGPHLTGFEQALTSVFNDYAKDKGLNKTKGRKKDTIKFKTSDVMEGVVGVFELRVPAQVAEFIGQTKDELATAQALPVVKEIVTTELTNYLYDHEKIATEIVAKMVDAYKSREAAKTAREESRKAREKSGGLENFAVMSKYKPATGGNPTINELFIVEGNSAAGAKRNRETQGMMPLRGKIKNGEDLSLSEILKNEEIKSIVHAIGAGIGPEFNLENIQYDKTVLMSDRDADGSHIQLLLMSFFNRFMKPYVLAGHLYIADLPLYKATKYVKNKKGKTVPVVEWFRNEAEMQAARTRLLNDGYMIQRFKGLGEMNADEVGDAATNPETRVLRRITIEDTAAADHKMKVLMGNDASLRKIWLEEHVDFDELSKRG